jgi:hypothetical protein
MAYLEKYLIYKKKYLELKNIKGGMPPKKKVPEKKSEQDEKISNAWAKIMESENFIMDIEIIMFRDSITQEQATEIVKNKLLNDEETKQNYYKNNNLRPSMDLLNIKPNTVLEKDITIDNDSDDFF